MSDTVGPTSKSSSEIVLKFHYFDIISDCNTCINSWPILFFLIYNALDIKYFLQGVIRKYWGWTLKFFILKC